MSQGHRWKLCTRIALLMLAIASADGSPLFAADLEVDQLIALNLLLFVGGRSDQNM
jgi:hypothetical protein